MRCNVPIFVVVGAALALAGSVAPSRAEPGVRELPEVRREGPVSVERALASRRSRRSYTEAPLSLAEVAQLLWAAQGVTGPDGLRSAPSAGALHPLEILLVAGDVSGLRPGVYRYEPARHRLRLEVTGDLREAMAEKALEQAWVAEAPALLVIAAAVHRTARKYGSRAERYALIEAGHAAQNVYLQAEALGLATVIVGAFEDEPLGRLLRLPAGQQPIGLMPVGRRKGAPGEGEG